MSELFPITILLFITLLIIITFFILLNDKLLILFTTLLLYFASGLYMLSYYEKIRVVGVTIFPADLISIVFPLIFLKDLFTKKYFINKDNSKLLIWSFLYFFFVIINTIRQVDDIGGFNSFKIISYEWISLSILLFFAIYFNKVKHINILKDVVIYGSLILGILLLLDQYQTIFSLTGWTAGIRLTTTHKGFLFFMPILILFTDTSRYSFIKYPLLIISCFHLLISTKRSIIIGIVLASVYFLFRYRHLYVKKILVTSIVLLILAFVFFDDFVTSYGELLLFRFKELGNIESGTAGRRLGAYAKAGNIFLGSPLFGDTHRLYYSTSANVSLLKHLHNAFLEKLAMEGLFGFSLLMIVIYFSLKKKRNIKTKKEIIGFNNVINAMLLFSIPVLIFNTSWILIYPFSYLGISFSLRNKDEFTE